MNKVHNLDELVIYDGVNHAKSTGAGVRSVKNASN